MKIHVEMSLWRPLLRNLNTDKLTTDCRKFDIQNLWPDLWMTPVLKYLVCCTPSALIHVRRKAVYPRAENLARCEGLQLMCVITSPAWTPKVWDWVFSPKPPAWEVLAVKHLRLCLFVCIYRKIFLYQAELRWHQGSIRMCKIWLQLYHDATTNICTTLCWGNVFIFYLLPFMVWWVCLQLL